MHMPRMEANSDIALFSQQANKAPHPLGKLQVGRYGIVASGHPEMLMSHHSDNMRIHQDITSPGHNICECRILQDGGLEMAQNENGGIDRFRVKLCMKILGKSFPCCPNLPAGKLT